MNQCKGANIGYDQTIPRDLSFILAFKSNEMQPADLFSFSSPTLTFPWFLFNFIAYLLHFGDNIEVKAGTNTCRAYESVKGNLTQ